MLVQGFDDVRNDLEYDEDAHQRMRGLGQKHENGPHESPVPLVLYCGWRFARPTIRRRARFSDGPGFGNPVRLSGGGGRDSTESE